MPKANRDSRKVPVKGKLPLLHRRRFLAQLALGAGLSPLLAMARFGTTDLDAQTQSPLSAPQNVRAKKPLQASDFVYLGAMRVPGEVSSYSYAAMTARKVNGRLQFFMVGENSPNAVTNWGSFEPVWEFADTQSYDFDYRQTPRANLLTKWGDIYQGRRITYDTNGQPLPLQYLITPALLHRNGRLYWTYYDAYNVTQRDDPCIGMTVLNSGPATMRAYGPWGTNVGVKHTANWLVELPDDKLGVGATLQSGNSTSPWGPELLGGLVYPTEATPSGPSVPDLQVPYTYVRHEFMGGTITADGTLPAGATLKSLRRGNDYIWHDPRQSPGGAGVVTEVDPAKTGYGSFTQADGVGHCVYIDLPEKHGVLFVGNLGTGHVWYGYVTDCGHGRSNPCGGGQGPNASAWNARWWIYNPDDTADVRTGERSAWIAPVNAFDPTIAIAPFKLGCAKRVGGAYFDRDTRLLYVAAFQADDSVPGVFLPLIHVFSVR